MKGSTYRPDSEFPLWSGDGVVCRGSQRVYRAAVPRLCPARAAYAVLAAADAALAATGRTRALKPLLMPVLSAGRDAGTRRALLLGGAGDVALLVPGGFSAGLGAFLVGHAAWVRALRARGTGRARPVQVLPYVLVLVGANALLWRRTGSDRVPVLVYSTALTATALAALDAGDTRATVGGALFLLSDGLLAAERFAGVHLPAHEGLVMASYTAAQALLAAGGSRG
ncbi:MAG: hypothetical protein JWO60_2181 [Frankiales bacterium]|nr:hypothetical protein [Frankiales bacterium]